MRHASTNTRLGDLPETTSRVSTETNSHPRPAGGPIQLTVSSRGCLVLSENRDGCRLAGLIDIHRPSCGDAVRRMHEPKRLSRPCRLCAKLIRYFLSIGESILRILGPNPIRSAVAHAVNRLAAIFQRLQDPPTRPVNGLFGELYLIRSSRNPARMVAGWRSRIVPGSISATVTSGWM
jgi:hypothetical protein